MGMVKGFRMTKGMKHKRRSLIFILRPMGLIGLNVWVFLFFMAGMAYAEEKVTIGEVEDVVLLPWGVKVPARIDTGAATSSLDARELRVRDGVAEFKLPKNHGGLRLQLPVVEWQHIRGADFRERRPIVEITLCMGPRQIRTRVTLNDRSMTTYPLIIGRNVLKENFVVDCVQSRCLPPSCPEARSQ